MKDATTYTEKWTPITSTVEVRHPAWREDQITARIKAWTKKVVKAGFDAPAFTIAPDPVPYEWCPYPYDRTTKVRAIKLVYTGVTSVKLGDDTLIGAIDLTHSEPVWALAPSQSLSDAERTYVMAHAGTCVVCKTRRERASTLLFRTPEAKMIQIGRNCAAKVFGLSFDPFGFSELDSSAGGWDDEAFGGYQRHTVKSFASVATFTAAVIDTNGWVSRKMAQESNRDATSSLVTQAMYLYAGGGRMQKEERDEMLRGLLGKTGEPTEAHVKLGNEAHEWAKNLPVDGNDYEHKLRVLAKDNWCSDRDLGVACSVVVAFRKAMVIPEGAKPKQESTWIGEVGAAVGLKKKGSLPPIAGEVVAVIPTEFSDVVKVVTDLGNVVVAFMHAGGVRPGEKVTLGGTIKKHDFYKGVRQTVLTRAKFLDAA